MLGEVRTTIPESLIKEGGVSTSKTLSMKGGKIKRSKAKMGKGQRIHVDDGSDNSSLCGNSDLSNISDESLPSDMEEVEVGMSFHLSSLNLAFCYVSFILYNGDKCGLHLMLL